MNPEMPGEPPSQPDAPGGANEGVKPNTAVGSGASGSPAQKTEPRQVIGGYVVIRKLGEGGMGTVYLAEDTKLGRKAAIKTLLPEFAADEVLRQRFDREARAAAAVEHENIVPIWGFGETSDGIPYIAMPFLQGESLSDRLNRQPVASVSFILKVARDVAEGLAAAHAKGLIHRDIKPDNVWLDGDLASPEPSQQVRRCKILDFGIARPADPEDHQLTKTGVILGTPAYMAPEQALGEEIDHRVDLFALGVILFRMATGRMPFLGESRISLMIAITTDPAPPVWTLNPDLPPALSELIDKLLSKNAADRPQTAAEVSATVRRIARQRQARAMNTSPTQEETTTQGKPLAQPPARAAAPPAPAPVPAPRPAASSASPPRPNLATKTNPDSGEATAAELAPSPKPKPKLAVKAAPEPQVDPEPEPDPEPEAEYVPGTRKRINRAKKARKRKKGMVQLAVWGGVLVAIAVAAFVLLRGPGEGTLELRMDDPTAENRMKVGRVVLVSSDGKERFPMAPGERSGKVPAGRYTVRVDGASDVVPDPTDITFKRGETVTVRISAVSNPGKKPDLPKPPPPKDVPPRPEVERKAAEYILENGGEVRVEHEGREIAVRDAAELPEGELRLIFVRLGRTATATDAGFAALAGCRYLRHFDLQGAKVGTAGLAHLKPLTTVQFLAISPNFDDAGLALFDGCTELRTFWAGGTKITDVGLAKLKSHPKLNDVRISDTALTDAGLAHLKECKSLTFLFVPKTQVTAAGIADFARALPRCKIEWSGGTIEPRNAKTGD